MIFDRDKFFQGYREAFGKMSQRQVDGLNELLSFIEADPFIKDFRWAAYMLATVKVETAETYKPIHEYGGKSYFIKRYGGQTRKGKELGNDTPDEGYYYAGKGYPQTTGEANYEKAEAAIRKQYPHIVENFEARTGKKFDLTVGDQPNDELDPQNMLDPAISYATMSYGMRTGMFTGKKLSDYIKGTTTDYKNARRIINGVDRNVEIAEYAKQFSAILRDSVTSTSSAAPTKSPSEKPFKAENEQGKADPAIAADPIAETKTTEIVQDANVTHAVETTVPKGDPPDAEPTKVTKNGPITTWLFSGGGLAAVGAAVWGFVQSNLNAVAVGIICLTLLIVVLIFRKALTDAIRMQIAADPDKKNVS